MQGTDIHGLNPVSFLFTTQSYESVSHHSIVLDPNSLRWSWLIQFDWSMPTQLSMHGICLVDIGSEKLLGPQQLVVWHVEMFLWFMRYWGARNAFGITYGPRLHLAEIEHSGHIKIIFHSGYYLIIFFFLNATCVGMYVERSISR